MDDSIASCTTYRITLISGILASLGALIAWVGWLALRMPKKELFITAGAGLVVGYAVHWTHLYVTVARRESVGDSTGVAAHGGRAPANRGSWCCLTAWVPALVSE